MSFADAYLQKHVTGKTFIPEDPDPGLNIIIAIPAFNESRLLECLDSLFQCDRPKNPVEVLVLINHSRNADKDIISLNRTVYHSAKTWADEHQSDKLCYHISYADDLEHKHFGAGLARKLVMDEAIGRFNRIDRKAGIIVSLDADCTVSTNYLTSLELHFEQYPAASGCSINFSHPMSGTEFPEPVYRAIKNYELHLRYYLAAIRSTGYPYAFHTVGSAFAVRAGTYASLGGMNRRQAGEDFYFIQKVAIQGNYTECNEATIIPSPRPSDRVPFGTGPEIMRQLKSNDSVYLTYAPELFHNLKNFYDLIPRFFTQESHDKHISLLPSYMKDYLKESGFMASLQEIKDNVASPSAFRKRFFQKFNMFWILKYIHFAEETGVKRVDIQDAVKHIPVL